MPQRYFMNVLVNHHDGVVTQRTFMVNYDHKIEYDSDIKTVEIELTKLISDAASVILLDWKELLGQIRPSQ